MDLNNPDGIANLKEFSNQLAQNLPENKDNPIILVPGFSGWGTPLFGSINYWGGIENIPKLLMDKGYSVIVTPIAPLSSNWERACELYRQLTIGRYTSKTLPPCKTCLKSQVEYF
jgi:triacylglycerol esterase/lipase EstA (alpha/beta hydrolase family)